MAIPIIRSDRKTVAMSGALVRAIQQLEDELERNNLSMRIICNDCLAQFSGDPAQLPYVQGNNSRTDTKYTLTCPCTRRVYEVVQTK